MDFKIKECEERNKLKFERVRKGVLDEFEEASEDFTKLYTKTRSTSVRLSSKEDDDSEKESLFSMNSSAVCQAMISTNGPVE